MYQPAKCLVHDFSFFVKQKGNTALHIASLAGSEDVVKLLLQNGANVNVSPVLTFV